MSDFSIWVQFKFSIIYVVATTYPLSDSIPWRICSLFSSNPFIFIFTPSTLHGLRSLFSSTCRWWVSWFGWPYRSTTHILHFGCAENQNHGLKFHSRSERILEFQQVQSYTSCQSTLLNHPVNNYSTSSLISDIEGLLNTLRPDIVFIPNPSYNQDHQAVYDASVIALRPHDLNHNPPVVLVYYQPQDIWQPKSPIDPSVFIGVDVERHLHVYSLLASQVRSHQSPISFGPCWVYGACIGNEYALPLNFA